MTPTIDLLGLPIEEQAIEYFDRMKAAQSAPDKVVKVMFKINSTARKVVDAVINDQEMFFPNYI